MSRPEYWSTERGGEAWSAKCPLDALRRHDDYTYEVGQVVTIYSGFEGEPPSPSELILVGQIANILTSTAKELYGDQSEYWEFDAFAFEAHIRGAIDNWFTEHNCLPKFSSLDNVRRHQFVIYDLDEGIITEIEEI